MFSYIREISWYIGDISWYIGGWYIKPQSLDVGEPNW